MNKKADKLKRLLKNISDALNSKELQNIVDNILKNADKILSVEEDEDLKKKFKIKF